MSESNSKPAQQGYSRATQREQWTYAAPTEPGLYLKWSQGAVKAEIVVVGRKLGGAALSGMTVQWLRLPYPLPEGA